jgi:translation initiation factor IF-2
MVEIPITPEHRPYRREPGRGPGPGGDRGPRPAGSQDNRGPRPAGSQDNRGPRPARITGAGSQDNRGPRPAGAQDNRGPRPAGSQDNRGPRPVAGAVPVLLVARGARPVQLTQVDMPLQSDERRKAPGPNRKPGGPAKDTAADKAKKTAAAGKGKGREQLSKQALLERGASV